MTRKDHSSKSPGTKAKHIIQSAFKFNKYESNPSQRSLISAPNHENSTQFSAGSEPGINIFPPQLPMPRISQAFCVPSPDLTTPETATFLTNDGMNNVNNNSTNNHYPTGDLVPAQNNRSGHTVSLISSNRSSNNSCAYSYYSYHSYGPSDRNSSSSNFTAPTQNSSKGTGSTQSPHHQSFPGNSNSHSLPVLLPTVTLHRAQSTPSLVPQKVSNSSTESRSEQGLPIPLFLNTSAQSTADLSLSSSTVSSANSSQIGLDSAFASVAGASSVTTGAKNTSRHNSSHIAFCNSSTTISARLPAPPSIRKVDTNAFLPPEANRDLADDIISSYTMSNSVDTGSDSLSDEQERLDYISKPLIAASKPTAQNPTTFVSPSDDTCRDRYGFKKQSPFVTEAQFDAWWKEYNPYLERRKKKWLQLMKDNGLSVTNDQPQRFPPKSEKLKRYIRKGIPAEWRGNAWFYYAKGSEKLNANKGVYEKLCLQTVGLKNSDTEIIERDLYRTFPDNIHFRHDTKTAAQTGTNPLPHSTEEPILITALRRLLVSFSVYQPKIGYCQSLNFLAGLLLLFMDEEKAFWMLVIITQRYLPGVHEINLEGVNVDQGVLMLCTREALPKLWNKIGVNFDGKHDSNMLSKLPPITLCTAAWFMSGYIGILPIETVLRVWDCFFFEDSKTFFRIALTIFKLAEPEIEKTHDPMEIFQIVQTFPKKLIDPSTLMASCFKRRNGIGHISQDEIKNMRDFVRLRRQQANIAALKQQQSIYAPAPAQPPSISNGTSINEGDGSSNGNSKASPNSTKGKTTTPTARRRASTVSLGTFPSALVKSKSNAELSKSNRPPSVNPFAKSNINLANMNSSPSSTNNDTTKKPKPKKKRISGIMSSKDKKKSIDSDAQKSPRSPFSPTDNNDDDLQNRNSTDVSEERRSTADFSFLRGGSQQQKQKAQQQVSNDLDDYLHFKHPHGLHSNFTKRMKSLKLTSSSSSPFQKSRK